MTAAHLDAHRTQRPPLGPWMQHAACHGEPGDLFFPGQGGDHRPALTICARCPVKGPCLAYAIEHHEHVGIWGGTTARKRTQMRRRARMRARGRVG